MAPFFFFFLVIRFSLQCLSKAVYVLFLCVQESTWWGCFISWLSVNFPLFLPPLLIKQLIDKTIKWNTCPYVFKCSQFREALWFWSSFAFCNLLSLQEEGHLMDIVSYTGLEPPVIQTLHICIQVVLSYITNAELSVSSQKLSLNVPVSLLIVLEVKNL